MLVLYGGDVAAYLSSDGSRPIPEKLGQLTGLIFCGIRRESFLIQRHCAIGITRSQPLTPNPRCDGIHCLTGLE
jgi:hypothetical protein